MQCPECNQQGISEAYFCTSCGRRLTGVQPPFSSVVYTRLYRVRHGRMVGGVCAGIARECGLDVTLVRMIAVVLFLLGLGATLLFYIAAWIIMPLEPVSLLAVPYGGEGVPPGAVAS